MRHSQVFASRFYWGGLKTPSLDVYQLQGTANQDTGSRQSMSSQHQQSEPQRQVNGLGDFVLVLV